MKKAPEAFRTISEVSEILDTPAHVLRFWESKFYQIKPVKRAGGRRYYRPDDVALIAGIKVLLQDQGLTIRGVQRVLHEQGVRTVAALAPSMEAIAVTHPPEDHADLPASTVNDRYDIEDAQVIEEAAQEPEAFDEQDTVSDSSADTPELDDLVTEMALAEIGAPESPIPVDVEETEADLPLETAQDDQTPAELLPIDDDVPPMTPPADEQPPARPALSDPPALPETAPAMAELRIARLLRTRPRGSLGRDLERAQSLSRRIDALLDRMSEASGAGRW